MISGSNQHLANLLKQAGVTGWEMEHGFCKPRRFRFDFAFPASMLAIEIQGGLWVRGAHLRPIRYEQDMEKHNLAVARGWRLLYVTPGMLKKDPVSFITLVKQMLRADLKSLVNEFSIELAPLLIDLGLPETNIEGAIFVAEDLLEKIALRRWTLPPVVRH